MLTGISFGDQAQFFRTAAIGDRFPAYKIMEDVELSFLMKESGSVAFLPCSISNSVRKWERDGYVRNCAVVVWLTMRYVLAAKVRARFIGLRRLLCSLLSRKARRDMAGADVPRRTVIVFAKAPRKGAVKTRIAATHGDDCALAIYIAMLQRTAQTLVRFRHHVAYTGAMAPGDLARYFPRATSFFQQRGRTLGERQKNAFLHCAGAWIPKVLSHRMRLPRPHRPRHRGCVRRT